MNKLRYIVVMLCLLVVGGACAQERHPAALGGAPEYLGYTQVYDFIDELADMGIISVNSVVKPYDRNQIAAWLVEVAEADSLLSVRQRKELWFYLNDFALECEGMYDGVVQWSNVGAVVNKELWGDFYQITHFARDFYSARHNEQALSALANRKNIQITDSKLDSALACRKNSSFLIPHSSLFSISLFQPAFHYADENFECKINPILGMDLTMNGHGMVMHRWYGAEIRADIVDHLAVWGSIRDHSYSGEHLDEAYFKSVGQSKRQGALLSRPEFMNNLSGGAYHPMSYGGDYAEIRAGIKAYTWWGSIGLVKDNLQWGDSYYSSNIISNHAPSFPMIELKLKPAKWFRLDYIHGFLASELVDSTKYYVGDTTITGALDKYYRPASKYIAANMLTFTPVKGLDLSVGSSIIYGTGAMWAAFSLPISFFNSIDHQMNFNAADNENTQIFLNISTRNLKYTHFYASVFVDEFSFGRLKKSSNQFNYFGWKVGGRLSNWPVKDLSVMVEYTQTNPGAYEHLYDILKYTSNGYGLGHYLGDNAREVVAKVSYKPVRGLSLELSYIGARKYNELVCEYGSTFITRKPYENIVWRNDEVKLHAVYEVVNNAYAFVDVGWNNARGFDVDNDNTGAEIRLDAQGYLKRYTPAFYWGQNVTVKMGFSFYY
ncbi:MAG: hypothetical protein IIX03_05475 [Paludibacteraceae bacterium]|nr:hypothetical protein [Paludibacteraceae bacterium]